MKLITGANGFIGKSLARKLTDIYTLDTSECWYNGDLCDKDFVKRLPDVDTVIHLAAFNSTKHFYSNPYSVLKSIVTPTMNLLERYPDAHFVLASTSESYASTVNQGWADVPTPESVALSVEDITNPRWCYASAKIAMESAVISRGVEFGSSWTILRYHNVYGANQKNHFIPEFAARVKSDGRVWGADETRSFCYIDDAVNLTKKVINVKNEIVNIGCPTETSILEMAVRIADILDVDTKLEPRESLPGSTTRRLPDLTKLKSIVGDYTWTDLDTGLRKTLGK